MSQQALTPVHMKLSMKGIKGSKKRTLNGQNRFCQVFTFKFIYFLIGGGPLALKTRGVFLYAHFKLTWFAVFHPHSGSGVENGSRHEGLLEKHVLNILRNSDCQLDMEKKQENSKDQTQDASKAQ